MLDLDSVGTNMVIMHKLYEEQHVLILWGKVFKWITKKECSPQFASHNLHDFTDMLTIEFLVELPPEREVDLNFELTSRAKPPNKALVEKRWSS